jgi:hypothetical protein
MQWTHQPLQESKLVHRSESLIEDSYTKEHKFANSICEQQKFQNLQKIEDDQ